MVEGREAAGTVAGELVLAVESGAAGRWLHHTRSGATCYYQVMLYTILSVNLLHLVHPRRRLYVAVLLNSGCHLLRPYSRGPCHALCSQTPQFHIQSASHLAALLDAAPDRATDQCLF